MKVAHVDNHEEQEDEAKNAEEPKPEEERELDNSCQTVHIPIPKAAAAAEDSSSPSPAAPPQLFREEESQSSVLLQSSTPKGEKEKTRKACSQCSYTSSHQASLNMHIRKKHKADQETEHTCNQCSYRTEDQIALQLHLIEEHEDTDENAKDKDDLESQETEQEDMSSDCELSGSDIDDDDDELIDVAYEGDDVEMRDVTNDDKAQVNHCSTMIKFANDSYASYHYV